MNNKDTEHYRKSHVFDPIHNGADECECGLTENADIHESDQAYEERMRPRIVNAPAQIWLQVGCDDEVGEIDWKKLSHSDVSWCGEKIHNTDIEYARVDLPPAPDEADKALAQGVVLSEREATRIGSQIVGDVLSQMGVRGSKEEREGADLIAAAWVAKIVERVTDEFAAALAQARKQTWQSAARLARAMAVGETFETGRQKALNIAVALQSASKQER